MSDVELPVRGSSGRRSPARAGGVLAVALDDRGLTEVVPTASAYATATGAWLTVFAPARIPFWWAMAASGWMVAPRPFAGDARTELEAHYRRRVAELVPGTRCDVRCRAGRVESWLGLVLRAGRFETVLVGAARIRKRRARRLAEIAGPERTFAILTPLPELGSSPGGAPAGGCVV